jgi:tight adherence protein B
VNGSSARYGLAVAVAAGAVAVLLGSATEAVAASSGPQGRVVQATAKPTASGAQVTMYFEASGLPAGTTIDPASVKVTTAGGTLPSTATAVGTSGAEVQRVAVLAMDTSGSMNGTRIAEAKAAASDFLSAVPSSVKVGLLSFADTPKVNVAPTLDHAAVAAAINRITAPPNGGTALYDAVRLAVSSTGSTGIRQVLLLSDGADDGSSTSSLADATQSIAQAQVVFDAVALGTGAQLTTLKAMTTAGKGDLVATNQASDLSAIFAESANAISNQLQVLVDVPADQLSNQQLTVRAQAGTATLSDTVFVPLAAVSSTAKASASPSITAGPIPVTATWYARFGTVGLWLALGALFTGLLVLLAVALRSLSRDRPPTVDRKMSIYTLRGAHPVKESETTTALGGSAIAKSAVELAGRVAVSRDLEGELALRLDRAALPLKPAEWMIIHAGITLGGGLVAALLTRRLLIALVAVLLGALIPWGYLDVRGRQRLTAFNDQLPDTLQMMAGGLQAGYSLPQAVDSVVREGADPIAAEFNRALVETRLGVPVEDALEGVAERMESVDFGWTVMAIRIQREVGGNLAEILRNVAATLRERERLRRQVRVLSAEGRLSAWIIGLMPFVFALFLLLVRPGYFELLYTTAVGWILLGVSLVLMVVGVIWLRNAVKVEY